MAFAFLPNQPMYSQGAMIALNLGGDINEIERVVSQFRNDEPLDGVIWHDAWAELASGIAELAREEEKAGHRVSAGHKHRRAAIYQIIAERYLDATDPLRPVAYGGMLGEFAAFVENARVPVELVEIPYGDTSLPALFIPAAGDAPAPTVININGFDTFKELLYLRLGDQARDRGLATLIVDLPGVGESLRRRGLPARHDTEVPIGACIDYLETRSEVDSDRIGLMGNSLAGYYGPRAAAFEKRLKCCVAWAAAFDAAELFSFVMGHAEAGRSSWPASQLQWVTGQDTVQAATKVLESFTLEHVLGELTVPLLILHGEADHLVPWHHAQRTADAATSSPRVDLVKGTPEVGGAGHVSSDNFQSGSDLVYDWVAEVLVDGTPIG